MFFGSAYKGGSLRASFYGPGEVVETSRGTVLESAWVSSEELWRSRRVLSTEAD